MSEIKQNHTSEIRLIQFNKYIRPSIAEVKNREWVMNGRDNSFYTYTIDRLNGSATNSAIINSYSDLVYGKGLCNTNGKVEEWLKFRKLINDNEIRKIVMDYVLFGEAGMQIIPANSSSKLPTCYHIPKQNTLPNKINDKGEIEGYWYADDWSKVRTEEDAEFFKNISEDRNGETTVHIIRPYKAGKVYFSDPDYLAGMPYAELEEEIANYYLSHIKNGLSFGYIINIPDGNSYTEQEKEDIERKIKSRLSGSSNAGKFIINFNGRDAEITVTAIEVNDAHSQWEYLTSEARQQLMTAHRVTSPMLFGIKDSTGLGNNAEELDTAEAQLMKRVISPKQRYITEALEYVAGIFDINVELMFKPLTEPTEVPALEDSMVMSKQTFSAQNAIEKLLDPIANELVNLGEDVDDTEWELIEERVANSHTLSEDKLLSILDLASIVKSTPRNKSKQDTSLFKIRYVYKGNPKPERDFCKKMIKSKKVYRIEDLENAENQVLNAGFGEGGKDKYSILKYKGGVNCKHFWERRIYLKRNNQKISVNQARKLILELEPKERPDAKWEQNAKEVAVIASPSNNYWKVNKK